MLTEALADFHFLVPDGTEPINEQVFRSLHPCAADDKIAALEVAEIEIVCAADGAVVILEPGVDATPCSSGVGACRAFGSSLKSACTLEKSPRKSHT